MDMNLTNIFTDIQKIIDNGSSLSHAISVVCEKNSLNPYEIYNMYFKNNKPKTKKNELSVGGYAMLKNNSNTKYEVININDRDAILLRDVNDNSEITASENEIIPVVMENKMNKLNEASYNLSVDGLTTEDAATLSQILSLANQAEDSSSVMNDPMQSNMEIPSEESTMETPMDMENNDVPEEDYEMSFDEELPDDTDIETINGNYSDNNDNSVFDDLDNTMEEDVILDKSQSDPTVVAKEEEENLNEVEETIPGEELEEETVNETKCETPQDKFAEEITESDDDYDMTEDEMNEHLNSALKNAGISLDESEESKKELNRKAYVKAPEDEVKEENEQSYETVNTDGFGKEASEGMKQPMFMESTVNKNKIKAIYETAKYMYAKKDSKDWLSLDRRYVEKLIKEGVSYSKASQMILSAKKGK